MKNRSKLILLKNIFNSPFPLSKSNLLDILEDEDIFISERTLDRYIKDLVNLFFIQSIKRKGYVKNELIDEKEANLYVQYLRMNVLSQNLIQFSENSRENNKYIVTENLIFKGVEFITPILNAISKRKELQFVYYTQYTNKEVRTVIPLFLKEYQKRWYLIGLDKGKKNNMRIFGLDRIESLELSRKIMVKTDIDLYKSKFSNVIGVDLRPVNTNFPRAVSVRLKAKGLQPNIFKSLPLHSSQKIVEENNNFTIFKYLLFVNYELIQHLRMHKQFIEVVEPLWLKEYLK